MSPTPTPPLDDEVGTWTILGLAIATGWGIVKGVIALAEWLDGDRVVPWRKEI